MPGGCPATPAMTSRSLSTHFSVYPERQTRPQLRITVLETSPWRCIRSQMPQDQAWLPVRVRLKVMVAGLGGFLGGTPRAAEFRSQLNGSHLFTKVFSQIKLLCGQNLCEEDPVCNSWNGKASLVILWLVVLMSMYLSMLKGQGSSCFVATSLLSTRGFPGGSEVKNLPANAGDMGLIPGFGRSPGEGNGNHSSLLAWEIPWTEELGGLQSTGLQRVRHDWAHTHTCSSSTHPHSL